MRDIRFRAWGGDEFTFLDYAKGDIYRCGSFFDGIEQYTGLKDLNGVEIYEGDLIENERGRVCKVVWHEYCASFDAEHVSDSEPNRKIDRARGFENNMWNSCIEVIGNIHENPELLEPK